MTDLTKILTMALAFAVLSCGAATNVVAGAALPNAWPAALAPAWRDFESKCAAKMATRGDLIGLKRFIAAARIPNDLKTALMRDARSAYQQSRRQVPAGGTK